MTPPKAPPTIDPHAVDAARRGEAEGLRAVATQAYPLVRRWVSASGARPDEVDDATQDVMVLVLRKITTFRGEARFTTWLFRVTRRAMLDRAKARSRRERRLAGIEAAHTVPAPAGDPAQSVEHGRMLRSVREAFRALPARQRQVFDLADLQGYGGAEIARMLDLAPSSVRVSLLKARRAIRSRLLDDHPDLVKELDHDV